MAGNSALSEFRDGQLEDISQIKLDFQFTFLWEQGLYGHVM